MSYGIGSGESYVSSLTLKFFNDTNQYVPERVQNHPWRGAHVVCSSLPFSTVVSDCCRRRRYIVNMTAGAQRIYPASGDDHDLASSAFAAIFASSESGESVMLPQRNWSPGYLRWGRNAGCPFVEVSCWRLFSSSVCIECRALLAHTQTRKHTHARTGMHARTHTPTGVVRKPLDGRPVMHYLPSSWLVVCLPFGCAQRACACFPLLQQPPGPDNWGDRYFCTSNNKRQCTGDRLMSAACYLLEYSSTANDAGDVFYTRSDTSPSDTTEVANVNAPYLPNEYVPPACGTTPWY